MQPDLLCGQNRFPAHLDTPTTLDVASGAVGGVENGEPGVDGSADRANGLFDVENDLTNNLDSVEASTYIIWVSILENLTLFYANKRFCYLLYGKKKNSTCNMQK